MKSLPTTSTSIVPVPHRRRQGLALLTLTLAGLLGACSPLRTVDHITPATGYVAHLDLAYGALPRQKLDVYVPVMGTPVPAGGWPVVVFFYGGSWREGSKSDYRFVAQALAARGVLVVMPDYRVYPETQYTGILQDSAAATAWALSHVADYGANPARVLVAGHSAGAYNAAMVALDPRWLGAHVISPRRLAGFIGLAGPYDFLPIVDADVKPVFNWPATPPEAMPIFYLRDGRTPARALPHTLLIAPVQDNMVDPQRNSEGLATALRAAGGDVILHRHASLSHITTVAAFAWPLRGLAPVLDEVADFARAVPEASAAKALP